MASKHTATVPFSPSILFPKFETLFYFRELLGSQTLFHSTERWPTWKSKIIIKVEYKKDTVKKWSSTLDNNLSFKTKGGQVANLRSMADAK